MLFARNVVETCLKHAPILRQKDDKEDEDMHSHLIIIHLCLSAAGRSNNTTVRGRARAALTLPRSSQGPGV